MKNEISKVDLLVNGVRIEGVGTSATSFKTPKVWLHLDKGEEVSTLIVHTKCNHTVTAKILTNSDTMQRLEALKPSEESPFTITFLNEEETEDPHPRDRGLI